MNVPPNIRPISFSENDIHIPRFSDVNLQTQLYLQLPVTPRKENWSSLIHYLALRFSFHLTLISLFETIFFWNFISKSEDKALVDMINGYTSGVVTSCQYLTPPVKQLIYDAIALVLNQTTAASAAAYADRRSYNQVLTRNSWIYFGGIALLFAGLSASNHACRNDVNWRNLILENIALVGVLGLYELMFFSTIILNYRSISIQELDGIVVNELLAAC